MSADDSGDIWCFLGIVEPVVSVLIHPSPAARLSAAWCLRSIAVALPSQMTIFIERCVTRMQRLKSSTEAISGYSFALTALLGGVRETTLGIPHAKGKVSYICCCCVSGVVPYASVVMSVQLYLVLTPSTVKILA